MVQNDGNTIIVDFSNPLTSMDTSSRQKINKPNDILNYVVEKIDLIDILKTLHPPPNPEYVLFSSAHGTFPRIDHRLGHKLISTNLRVYKLLQTSSLALLA